MSHLQPNLNHQNGWVSNWEEYIILPVLTNKQYENFVSDSKKIVIILPGLELDPVMVGAYHEWTISVHEDIFLE